MYIIVDNRFKLYQRNANFTDVRARFGMERIQYGLNSVSGTEWIRLAIRNVFGERYGIHSASGTEVWLVKNTSYVEMRGAQRIVAHDRISIQCVSAVRHDEGSKNLNQQTR